MPILPIPWRPNIRSNRAARYLGHSIRARTLANSYTLSVDGILVGRYRSMDSFLDAESYLCRDIRASFCRSLNPLYFTARG